LRTVALAAIWFFSCLWQAGGETFAERLAACLACHGEKGQSETPDVPSLGRQPALYTMLQLHMFREKLRTDAVMNELARGITDDELRRFADELAGLPPPKPPDASPDPARMERGKALAAAGRCDFCHNADFSGKDQNPRIANQREDYLARSLADYRAGARIGYRAAMAESVRGLSDADIRDLAYFLAHFR
jgi:cytochrome c553